MLRGFELLVSPDLYIVHIHVGNASVSPRAPTGSRGNWGSDEHAKELKQGNIELFGRLQARMPKGIQHGMNVKWRDVYPTCVLQHPENYVWALGRVAKKCSAWSANWGTCQPLPVRVQLIGHL